MGEMVEFASNGSTAGGYLSPAHGGAGLGVIVIQEWWGLVPHIVDVCDRLAAEGFTALAPDLYHGKTVPNGEPDEAKKSAMALDAERAARDMSGAVDYLAAHPAVRGKGVGVVGFCMGGGLALWLATLRPDAVRAAVPFYGTPGRNEPDWSKLTAAVEGHYAEKDEMAGFDVARQLETTLTDLGKEVRIFLYPNTKHAFFNDTRPEAHDPDAARQAWVRTLEFLRAKLG
ncbi:MAG: dienelactone hydrolase family protein [Actinomycetota bacterium]|nr:dienelactone hydrolase family protein [Actinomycetota bacterium]